MNGLEKREDADGREKEADITDKEKSRQSNS